MTIERIIEVIKKNQPDIDTNLLELAYEYAKEAHQGQKRLSGEDYIQHPLETSYKLAQMNLDMSTIIAGILHDVPEDTDRSINDIEKNFGKDVATLIGGITKVGTIKYRGLERYAENLRKMFIAMAKDVRVVFIKFADRIHNLKTLDAQPPIKQQRIARETLEIYAPIANRLGMEELKGELEDLSFPFIYPEKYKWVKSIVDKKYAERKRYTDKVIKKVKKEILNNSTVKLIDIEGRAKHYFSLYQKLIRKNKEIENIYDLIAMRIIVRNIDDCYHAMGHIHKLWSPVKGRFKDYIAQPKPNGYQSLHTTVYCDEGRIAEFQIRTKKMHEKAEYGVAAHWSFKGTDSTGKKETAYVPEEKIKLFKELMQQSKQENSTKNYLDSLQLDFFDNRIFVFTPKGDVIELPEGSTPIDFAYHVHSDIGHKCTGAKINEKMVNLNSAIKNGDMVEIILDKNRKGPSEDWINIVKTHHAKRKIKDFFNKQKRLNIFKFFNR
jgi:GTP diphosphokinase / guanosine-3',5'-bis(diphosphate) 3'-diphosphatase